MDVSEPPRIGDQNSAADGHFWELADQLVATSEIVIDRPAGSRHPRQTEVIYPFDYGYLRGTAAVDGGGVDIWRGSLPDQRVTAVIVTVDTLKRDVDTLKRDAEVKLLIGCRPDEARRALAIHQRETQAAVLVWRDHFAPGAGDDRRQNPAP